MYIAYLLNKNDFFSVFALVVGVSILYGLGLFRCQRVTHLLWIAKTIKYMWFNTSDEENIFFWLVLYIL